MFDDTATLLPRSRRVVAESRRGLGIIVTQCFLDGERNDREKSGGSMEVPSWWILCVVPSGS